MMRVSIKHCGYGYLEETANDLIDHMKAGEEFRDIRVIPLSDILACLMLIYDETGSEV